MRDTPAVAFDTPFKVVAIIAAHNEGDVIHHVVRDLIENGLHVYFIDNASTDDTVSQVLPFLGRGLIHVERFPEDSGRPRDAVEKYYWIELLRRKEEVAVELEADWYVHADADEFRLGPWPGLNLAQAFRLVDAHGYSAVNFDLYDFRPTDDRFKAGEDVRKYVGRYEPGKAFDVLQVKAWKHSGARVDLASTGGHEVRFAGRRIFPVPFILQHFPLRSVDQARRKVHAERLSRFRPEERALGWHVQYDVFASGRRPFLWSPSALESFSSDSARLRAFERACTQVVVADELRGYPLAEATARPEHFHSALERRLGRRPCDSEIAKCEAAAMSLLLNEPHAIEQCRDMGPTGMVLVAARIDLELAYAKSTENLDMAKACTLALRRLALAGRSPATRHAAAPAANAVAARAGADDRRI